MGTSQCARPTLCCFLFLLPQLLVDSHGVGRVWEYFLSLYEGGNTYTIVKIIVITLQLESKCVNTLRVVRLEISRHAHACRPSTVRISLCRKWLSLQISEHLLLAQVYLFHNACKGKILEVQVNRVLFGVRHVFYIWNNLYAYLVHTTPSLFCCLQTYLSLNYRLRSTKSCLT